MYAATLTSFLLVGLIYWKAKPILMAVAQERSTSIKRAIEGAQQLVGRGREQIGEKLKRDGLSLIMKLRQSRPAQKLK